MWFTDLYNTLAVQPEWVKEMYCCGLPLGILFIIGIPIIGKNLRAYETKTTHYPSRASRPGYSALVDLYDQEVARTAVGPRGLYYPATEPREREMVPSFMEIEDRQESERISRQNAQIGERAIEVANQYQEAAITPDESFGNIVPESGWRNPWTNGEYLDWPGKG